MREKKEGSNGEKSRRKRKKNDMFGVKLFGSRERRDEKMYICIDRQRKQFLIERKEIWEI